jgi:hypothetical protein
MLINSYCVAGAPSRRVAEARSRGVAAAASRSQAGFGPGAIVRERRRAFPVADSGSLAGIWTGGANDAAGYLPGCGGALRRNPLARGPVQAGVVTKSIANNSNDKHNSIQMTRPVPASWGEVGPHRVREQPGPA